MLESILNALETLPGEFAFVVVLFILLICGLGVPLPEEFPLIAAGYLAHMGVVDIETALVGSLLGILVGDSMLFWIGQHLGNRIFNVPGFRKLLTEERMERVNHYFHRYGNRVVFLARFMAGVRGTVFVTAGILRMPFRRFLLLDGTAALVSVPLIVTLAYRFGDEIDQAMDVIKHAERTLLLLFVIGIAGFSAAYVWLRRRRQARTAEPGG